MYYIPTTISIRLYEASSESKQACIKAVLYATTTYRLTVADDSQTFQIVSHSGIIL